MNAPELGAPGSATAVAALVALALAASSAAAAAQDGLAGTAPAAAEPVALAETPAHGPAPVKLEVALRGDFVVVDMEATLASLLGFSHRPRTTAQHQAAQALLERLNAPQDLLRFDAAAGCELKASTVEASELTEGPPAFATVPADWSHAPDPARATVRASFEYSCAQPQRLASLDVALFEAFHGVQQVDVDVRGLREERQQQLKRPVLEESHVPDRANLGGPATRAWLIDAS